jgi:hypothetical protein
MVHDPSEVVFPIIGPEADDIHWPAKQSILPLRALMRSPSSTTKGYPQQTTLGRDARKRVKSSKKYEPFWG